MHKLLIVLFFIFISARAQALNPENHNVFVFGGASGFIDLGGKFEWTLMPTFYTDLSVNGPPAFFVIELGRTF